MQVLTSFVILGWMTIGYAIALQVEGPPAAIGALGAIFVGSGLSTMIWLGRKDEEIPSHPISGVDEKGLAGCGAALSIIGGASTLYARGSLPGPLISAPSFMIQYDFVTGAALGLGIALLYRVFSAAKQTR